MQIDKRQLLQDQYGDPADTALLFADGFDDAIIGVTYDRGAREPGYRVVYDQERCIEILVEGGMDEEEAEEYFDFNTEGAYVGAQTPVYITRLQLEDADVS